MFEIAQITRSLSENIGESLTKQAPTQNLTKQAQNLGQNLSPSHTTQNLTPRDQAQESTRQALTRFGNELAQNP